MKSYGLLAAGVLWCCSAGFAQAELVGYYTFDDDDAQDSSGFGNHGTVGASVAFSNDAPGVLSGSRSAVFNGTTGVAGVISAASSASLETVSNQLTLSFWLKADSTVNPSWVRFTRKANESNTSQGWMVTRNNLTAETLIRIDTAGGTGFFNQNRGTNAGLDVLNNDWHHIAYVLNNGVYTEYVNGVQTVTNTYNHSAGFSNTHPLLLGGTGGTNFTGLMDDYSIWSSALSASQILLLSQGVAATAVPEPSTLLLLLSLALLPLRRFLPLGRASSAR